ncbi:MAG: Transcriptional regulator PA2737, MerR family, partial [uncultured Ramlibacter sp.]
GAAGARQTPCRRGHARRGRGDRGRGLDPRRLRGQRAGARIQRRLGEAAARPARAVRDPRPPLGRPL